MWRLQGSQAGPCAPAVTKAGRQYAPDTSTSASSSAAAATMRRTGRLLRAAASGNGSDRWHDCCHCRCKGCSQGWATVLCRWHAADATTALGQREKPAMGSKCRDGALQRAGEQKARDQMSQIDPCTVNSKGWPSEGSPPMLWLARGGQAGGEHRRQLVLQASSIIQSYPGLTVPASDSRQAPPLTSSRQPFSSWRPRRPRPLSWAPQCAPARF